MKQSFWALVIGLVLFSCSEKKEETIVFSNENIESLSNYVTKENASEGETSFKMQESNEWGPTWRYTEEDLSISEFKSIEFNFDVLTQNATDSLIFVFEINDEKANKKVYEAFAFNNPDFSGSKWVSKTASFKIEGPYSKDSKIAFFFWNQKRKEFYVDNLVMKLK